MFKELLNVLIGWYRTVFCVAGVVSAVVPGVGCCSKLFFVAVLWAKLKTDCFQRLYRLVVGTCWNQEFYFWSNQLAASMFLKVARIDHWQLVWFFEGGVTICVHVSILNIVQILVTWSQSFYVSMCFFTHVKSNCSEYVCFPRKLEHPRQQHKKTWWKQQQITYSIIFIFDESLRCVHKSRYAC